MKNYLDFRAIIMIGLFLLVATVGCVGKKKTVKIIPAPEGPKECSQILVMTLFDIPDDSFHFVLDKAYQTNDLEYCWKPLIKKAIKEDKPIPMDHLAKAVHIFNRNDNKSHFSDVVYLFFKGVINGERAYGEIEKKLLAEYLSFSIQNAGSRQNPALEKAKLVCARLDPELYGKFFL